MNDSDQRLTELEIRITHQERLIEELSDVIHQESQRISDLERELRRLRQSLASLGPELTASPDE